MKKNTKSVGALLGEYGAFIALALLVIGLSLVSPEFRAPSNFMNLLRQATFNGLIAFGMTCVILSDGIDLSVGSTYALSAIVCAELIMHGMPAIVAILVALIVGTLLGVVSGILVTKVWARKPLMYTAAAAYAIVGLLLTFIPVPIVRVVLCIALGFIYYIPITAQSTLIIEYSFGIDPRMISGGIAMASGVGMLLTLIVSPIFTAITTAAGMTTAFRIFFAVMVVGIIAIFTAKETGRKPEGK